MSSLTARAALSQPMLAKLKDPRAETIPCPVLRTLVNADMLTPDADGFVKIDQLKEALQGIGIRGAALQGLLFGARNVEAGAFLKALRTDAFSLYKLKGSDLDHKADTQILRDGFSQARLDRLLSFSGDGATLSVADLARAQKEQFAEEPPGGRGAVLGVAELAAVLLVFGKRDEDGVKRLRKEDVVSLFRDAKIPDGFEPEPVGALELIAAVAKMAYAHKTTTAGRAKAGLDKALGRSEMLDATSAKGLQNAMCPVGMRPSTKTPPVSLKEVCDVHAPC